MNGKPSLTNALFRKQKGDFTMLYLSFTSYQKIMKENGRTIDEVNYKTFSDYTGFALHHGFAHFGLESRDDIGVLYHRYINWENKNRWG